MLQIQGPLVLHKVYFDEYSNFDPDVAGALLNSSKQVSETGWQDSVKVADSFHTRFDSSN